MHILPVTLHYWHGPYTGRMARISGCGMSFGDDKITDFDFADDAVNFAEAAETLTEDCIH